MGVLIDIFPVIIFFAVYKFSNIYAATSAAIIVSGFQILICYLKNRKVQSLQLITFLLLLILGGTTIVLHKPIFIKWKPTIIYWLFSLVFLSSYALRKPPFIRYVMGNKIKLPNKIWHYLNLSWVLFFAVMGVVNLYMIYHFSTNTWVNFKLFGILGITFLFVIIQALYLSKFIITEPPNDKKNL